MTEVKTAWRSIETAPRDGTPILLCLAKGVVGIGFIRAHRFDDLDLLDAPAAWVGTKQWEARPSVWMGGHDACEADAWMPLPELPPKGGIHADKE